MFAATVHGPQIHELATSTFAASVLGVAVAAFTIIAFRVVRRHWLHFPRGAVEDEEGVR